MSDSTLKYTASATLTQQHSYNQGFGVGSVSLDLMKLESLFGVGFLDSVELGVGVLIAFIRKPASHSLITNTKCPESNKDLFSPKDISSCLNNYFTSIAAKLANSLPKTSPSKPLNTVSTYSSLFIKPVIHEDIIREINLLDNSKCDD